MSTADDRLLRRCGIAGAMGVLLLGAAACGPAATAASGTTPPSGAGPSAGAFLCPSQDQVQAATGLPVTATRTSARCSWRAALDGKLANGVSIWNPSTSTATTLAGIRARFVAGNVAVVDRPELGAGAFEAPSRPPAGIVDRDCEVYLMSANGLVTQISVNHAQGPATDVCLYAEEVAHLVH